MYNNDLNHFEKSVYIDIVEEFAECFGKNSQVKAIGQFGCVNYPGISDLDLLVITQNDSAESIVNIFNEWVKKKPERQYVFFHPPLIITENMLSYLTYLHTIHGLYWISGSHDYVVDSTFLDSKFLDIIWVSFLVPIAVKLLYHERVNNLRKLLLVANNMVKSISTFSFRPSDLNLASNVTNKNISIREYFYEKLSIGSQFNDSDYKKLKAHFDYCFISMLSVVENYLADNNYYIHNNSKGRWINNYLYLCPSNEFKVVLSKSGVSSLKVPCYMYSLIKPNKMLLQNDKNVHSYYQAVDKATSFAKSENITYPFIKPFGYSISKNELYLYLRDLYLHITNRFKDQKG